MTATSERSLSLDMFRGLTVCFMIIVNTPGSGAAPYGPLLHAQWNGFTPTDLVFPSFLFAVGNAMSFAMAKLPDNITFLRKVTRRTLLIFTLGFLMYWFPFLDPFASTRVMGVLQRIALCYFLASLMLRYFSTRWVVITSIVLLVGYWCILLVFAANHDPYGMLNNAGTLLDRVIIGENHLYHGEGVAFDPEGLLGTFPATVNVIIGYYAGNYIRIHGKNFKVVAELLLAGLVLILLALSWNYFFPINKKIWSSSFVLLTSGLDLMILPALVYIVDIRKWNARVLTDFFIVFGKNPLFIYLLSELLAITFHRIRMSDGESFYQWINTVFFQPILPGPSGSLWFAASFMLVCWFVGWLLNKRKIYIRV